MALSIESILIRPPETPQSVMKLLEILTFRIEEDVIVV